MSKMSEIDDLFTRVKTLEQILTEDFKVPTGRFHDVYLKIKELESGQISEGSCTCCTDRIPEPEEHE